MKHYDSFEWILYKEKLLDDLLIDEMRDHLFNCEDCMDIYLSLISEEEEKNASKYIPENFSLDIIEKIEDLEDREINKIKKINKKNIFIQYVAVASITIFLTANGVFNKAIASSNKIDLNIKEESSITEKVYSISDKFTNEVLKDLNNINIKKIIEGKEGE